MNYLLQKIVSVQFLVLAVALAVGLSLIAVGCTATPPNPPSPTPLTSPSAVASFAKSPTAAPTPTGETRPITSPKATVTPYPISMLGWRRNLLVPDYYWVVDGERVDRYPRLSPDGRRMLFLPTEDKRDRHASLSVMDLDTGKVHDITPDRAWGYTSAYWSPDGQRIAFVRFRYDQAGQLPTETELWIVDADGSNPRRLWQGTQTPPGMNGPSAFVKEWMLDGDAVAISGTIWGGGVGAFRLILKADGSGQVYLPWPKASDLGLSENDSWHMDALSPRADFVLATAYSPAERWPTPAPKNYRSSIIRYDFATGRTTTLVSLPDTLSLKGLSRDGRTICFSSVPPPGPRREEPPKLWTVAADGTGLKQVADDPYRYIQDGDRCWGSGGPFVSNSDDGQRALAVKGEWERGEIWLLERE